MEKQQILDFLEENKLPPITSLKTLEDIKNDIINNIALKDVIEKWNEFSKGITITELDKEIQIELMFYRISLIIFRRVGVENLEMKDIPELESYKENSI